MNSVILMGNLCDDPELRYTQGENPMAVTRYRLAVSRGKEETDFISVVAFGKAGQLAGDYFKKGMKVCIQGRIQTGSYTNREGKKVYTTDVVAERQEFCEKKWEEPAPEFIQVDSTSELPFT